MLFAALLSLAGMIYRHYEMLGIGFSLRLRLICSLLRDAWVGASSGGWVWVVELSVAGTVCHRVGRVDFTLCSRVRHWDRLWSSIVKGEVGVVLLHPCHPAALWILPLSQYDEAGVLSCLPSPLIPLPSRERGIVVGLDLLLPHPVDTAFKPV